LIQKNSTGRAESATLASFYINFLILLSSINGCPRLYELPLAEIVDYLKEDEYFDVAAQIEALI